MKASGIKEHHGNNVLKTLSDNAVIERVLAGEKDLFELLIRRYNQLLFRVIRSYMNKESDAEDVMQDTYIKVYQKLYQFRYDAKFSTWLVRIGINEALQRKRRSKVKRTLEIDQFKGINQIEDTLEMNPEKQIIHSESKALIERAIDALPEKYKIVYMLREVEQLGISEISACLGLSESNVKVRIHRAKKMMKKHLFEATRTTGVFEFGDLKCDRMVNHVMAIILQL